MKENEFNYTKKCREISGWGGTYEKECRKMVIAGMKWFKKNPTEDPQFKQNLGCIMGINDSAIKLTKSMQKSIFYNATALQFAVSLNHIFHAKNIGWDDYIKDMETPILNTTKNIKPIKTHEQVFEFFDLYTFKEKNKISTNKKLTTKK